MEASYLYAFTAGMFATMSPCGFAMLPSFVSYYLGTEEAGFQETSLGHRVARGLLVGLVATLGFLAVYLLVGSVFSLGWRAIGRYIPWVSLAIGLGLVVVGLRLVAGRGVYVRLPFVPLDLRKRSTTTVFLYGVSYAITCLSCTLPIFLAAVGLVGTRASRDLGESLLVFAVYALGMGLVLTAVALGAALFKGIVALRLKTMLPYVEAASGLFLVGAGLYLVYYQLQYGLGLVL